MWQSYFSPNLQLSSYFIHAVLLVLFLFLFLGYPTQVTDFYLQIFRLFMCVYVYVRVCVCVYRHTCTPVLLWFLIIQSKAILLLVVSFCVTESENHKFE